MQRRAQLVRKTPLRPVGNTKYRRRQRQIGHMLLVKKLPCAVRWFTRESYSYVVQNMHCQIAATPCCGRVEADHVGKRTWGWNRKCADTETISLCQKHHHERTNVIRTFKNWNRDAMRAFCEIALEATRHEIFKMGLHGAAA